MPVHPICHRILHTTFTNAELARMTAAGEAPDTHPDIKRFLDWVSSKPPDFHAPTRKRRAS